MKPPPNKRPSRHCQRKNESDTSSSHRQSAVTANSFKLSYFSVTILVLFNLFVSLCLVRAGPVFLSPHQIQGAVTLARNIRHLPCISRKTGQEGVCMFAIDCLKANGSHLGTCIDRFYFGSCCQIPERNVLPQLIGNNIDENSIENANFVHPQPNNHINDISILNNDINKPTVEKVTTTVRTVEKTETPVESKIDNLSTIENRIEDKLSTVLETTTKTIPKLTEKTTLATITVSSEKPMIAPITEIPVKLSTFQTVNGENPITPTSNKPQTSSNNQTTPFKPFTTRKPTWTTPKPFKPRPTLKPLNFTRPQSTIRPNLNVTLRPRPTKPVSAFNITKIPPYRLPPKRPVTTKKPILIPPRLNITILPQSTSSRPLFTRPTSTITFINTNKTVENLSSTSEQTTLGVSSTTELSTTAFTSEKSSTSAPKPTVTSKPLVTAEDEPVTTEIVETTSGSTEFPPGLVTWTNNLDTPTRAPEVNVTTTEEVWSPITPPEGWVLISTIPPKSETTSSTTTTTTEEPSTTSTTTQKPTTTSTTTQKPTTTSTTTQKPTTTSTTTEKTTTTSTTTQKPTTTSTTTQKPTTTSTTTQKPTTTSTTTQKQTTSTTTTEQPTTSTTQRPTTTSTTTQKPTTTTTTEKATTTEVQTTQQETTINDITTETIDGTTSNIESDLTTIVGTNDDVTEPTILEFTVNVTLSPTMPTTTEAIGLSTFSSVSSVNDTVSSSTASSNATTIASLSTTESVNITESSTSSAPNTTQAVTTAAPVTEEPVNMTNYKDVCGRRLWPEARIVGGAKSGFGRWPWQISLRQWRTSTYLHKCGAALLNENWAITAAHCVEHVPPSELLVRLGEHDLANEDEPYGFAERRVQIVASHPHFDPSTFEYDLALLRFYEPVTFQPNILPVCVPDTDDNFVGRTAYVTGWGRLYDEGPLPSVLQEVSVPVINNTACESMYKAAGYDEHIPNIFICAGWKKGGSDSCEGDSGGPMVLQRERDKRFILGGVISWGIGCAEPNQPGVYTRISEFRDWINQILQF